MSAYENIDIDTIYEQILIIIKNNLATWLVGLPNIDIASKYSCEIVEGVVEEEQQRLAVAFGRRIIAIVRIKNDIVRIFLTKIVDYDEYDEEEYDKKEYGKYRLADPDCFTKVATDIIGIITHDMRTVVEAKEEAEKRKFEEEYEYDREIDSDLWEDHEEEEEEEEEEDY